MVNDGKKDQCPNREAPRLGGVQPRAGATNDLPWTVVRFPDGSWSSGGQPDDPDYAGCEVFVVEAPDRATAVKRAQARRRHQARKPARAE